MRTIILGICAALLLTSEGATAKSKSDLVKFNGCPEPSIEGKCVTVKSRGVTYDVTAAQPPIEIKGLGVAGSGTLSPKPGTCMAGKVLERIHYAYTRKKCPIVHSVTR